MQDQTFLVVGTLMWHTLWGTMHQIVSRLARQNRVLFLDPGRDPYRSAASELRRNLPHLWRYTPEQVNERLFRIPSPPVLPVMRESLPRSVLKVTFPAVTALNNRILARHARRVLRDFKVDAPILLLFHPHHVGLVGHLGEKLVCYFNYDEYPNYHTNVRVTDRLRAYDDALTRRADAVFATSRSQWQRRHALQPNTHFLPNGVDFELFNQALHESTEIPPEIADLPRPIIGFVGTMRHQIDVNLLLRVAERHSGALVLVGPDQLPDTPARRQLATLPHVRFVGAKPLVELPRYLKAFDVALIPYELSGNTLTVYPLKLHEYLAAGRPIVAVRLVELEPFRDVVYLADTDDDFVRLIDVAMAEDSPQRVAQRVAIAQENTWDQRVTQMQTALQVALEQRQNR